MTHASLPPIFWDEICSSVVYLINRLPNHSALIPYTKLLQKEPDYTLLRVIGCQCFPHIRPYNTNKLEPRALPFLFLGYATTQKGYRCLHLPSQKLYISRHVQFDETYFPFKNKSPSSTTPDSLINTQHSSLPLFFYSRHFLPSVLFPPFFYSWPINFSAHSRDRKSVV